MRNGVLAAATAAFLLTGCSSRPREFTQTLGVVPADQPKFDAAYAECKELFVTGKLDSNGRLASGGAGVAAGGEAGGVCTESTLPGLAGAAADGVMAPSSMMAATMTIQRMPPIEPEPSVVIRPGTL